MDLHLRHLSDERSTQRPEHLSPLTVHRPETGFSSTTTRCNWCGTEVELRIASSERLRQTRRQWALGFAAAILTLTAGALLVVTTTLTAPAAVLLIGGFLTTTFTAFGWSSAIGVRAIRTSADDKPGPHIVRRDNKRR
ncbi:hypothetical protein ACWEOE_36165 [Amycolatopsis sp. NPDC004368]